VVLGEQKQDVDVVFDATDHERRAFPIPQDAAQVTKQFGLDSVGDPGLAILRAEDEVEEVLAERLGHVISPIQGWGAWETVSQGFALGWIIKALQASNCKRQIG
jgi:hypothetical protein